MLQDLLHLKREAQRLIEENLSLELNFDDSSKHRILDIYKKEFPSYPATLQDGLIKIKNEKNQTAYLPFNWFVRIKQCKPLIEALLEYSKYVDMLKTVLADDTMRLLPKVEWKSSIDIPASEKSILDMFVDDKFTDADQNRFFRDFLDGRSWLELKNDKSDALTGKKLNRQNNDYIASCITTHCKLINDTAGKLEHFIKLYIASKEVRDTIEALAEAEPIAEPYTSDSIVTPKTKPLKTDFVNTAVNRIIYGAPGTGKSHSLKKDYDEEKLIRTVFHPDTQYSDFVGSLKPIMQEGSVGYEFRPGPFTEAIIKAVNHPTEPYYLVIEEINRASAAAVFGEIFQLLDRDDDGHSEYKIDISDPDFRDYLDSKTNNFFSEEKKLFIPSNLSLLATMNSSDQAVMPMDTAFKRRWEFSYLKINYKDASIGTLTIPVNSLDDRNTLTVSWATFAKVINERLSSENIPEDRLLGHRFLSETELEKDSVAALKGKLFLYLWDDVLRHGQHTLIFKDEVEDEDGELVTLNTFGLLVNAFEKDRAVFNDIVEQRLIEVHDESESAV